MKVIQTSQGGMWNYPFRVTLILEILFLTYIILQLTAHTELARFSITRSYGKNSFKVASSIDLKKALFMPDAAWWSVF